MHIHSRFLKLFVALSLVLLFTGIAQLAAEDTVVCPVSGKVIKKSEAKDTYEYKGKSYYFCCPNCKQKFIVDPEKYATGLEEKVVCQVSGKEMKKSEAAASYEYNGKLYYFCCEGCKEKFMKEPDKYINKKAEMKEMYTCPMHQEVKSDKPGKCPTCGMKLEKKMVPAEHSCTDQTCTHANKQGKSCCSDKSSGCCENKKK